MLVEKKLPFLLTIFTSIVWFVNGLFCKILNLVPRHQLIVSRILGDQHDWLLTKLIGAGEILITIWIISGTRRRICAVFQMVMVATMNVIEFMLVPDLLLFGKMNIVFAFLFVIVIYCNEFILASQKQYRIINN